MTIRNKYSHIAITALLICFAVIFFSCRKKTTLRVEAVKNNYGWGYNVLAGDRVYIKQDFIPALPGTHGFVSADDAMKVGTLVAKRISEGEQPTISRRDLDSLGIAIK